MTTRKYHPTFDDVPGYLQAFARQVLEYIAEYLDRLLEECDPATFALLAHSKPNEDPVITPTTRAKLLAGLRVHEQDVETLAVAAAIRAMPRDAIVVLFVIQTIDGVATQAMAVHLGLS